MTLGEAGAQQQSTLIGLLRGYSLQVGRFIDVFASAHELHRTDLDALGHLWQAESRDQAMTPGQLAAALSLSAPATSALLARLERGGHLERSRDPTNARRVLLRMRPSARQVALAFFTPLGAQLREAMNDFTAAELATAERFLRAAAAAVARAADDAAPRPTRHVDGKQSRHGSRTRPSSRPESTDPSSRKL